MSESSKIYRGKEGEERGGVSWKEDSPWTPQGSRGRPPWGVVGKELLLTVSCGFSLPFPWTYQAGTLEHFNSQRAVRRSQSPFIPQVLSLLTPLFLLSHPTLSRCISDPIGISSCRLDGRTISKSCPSFANVPWAWPYPLPGLWSWGLPWAFSQFLRIQLPSRDAFSVSGRKPVRFSFWFLSHLNDPFQKLAAGRDGNSSTWGCCRGVSMSKIPGSERSIIWVHVVAHICAYSEYMCVCMPRSVQEWGEKRVWACRQELTESKRTNEKRQVFTQRKNANTC